MESQIRWRPGQESLEQFLGTCLSANRLIRLPQSICGQIETTNESAPFDCEQKPVVRFTTDIYATRTGTLNGGNQMWIASFHWLASIGTMVRAGNSPWTSGRESAWSKIDLQMAVKNEFTFAVSNEFIFSASNEFIFVVGAEIALVGSCDEELAVLGHSLSKHPQEKAARAAAVSESDQWPSALCRSKQFPQNQN